jgi:translation initiation factor 2 subunit 2
VGKKKTLWINFEEICLAMNRTLDHLSEFMIAELGAKASIDNGNRLLLQGKFAPKVGIIYSI